MPSAGLWWKPCRSLQSPLHSPANPGLVRNDWTRAEVRALFALPFPELMFEAARIHRMHFDPSEVQISTLLSIKTGGCPEDCAYCPQAARYDTGVNAEKLMSLDAVLAEARAAKAAGASRFCMGAAWRSPKDRDVENVCAMVEGVKALGLETCATLGMLTPGAGEAAEGLAASTTTTTTSTPRRSIYGAIITTRTYQDRLDTLDAVRDAGINVCCGGIVGMGEGAEDRAGMIATLASLPVHPESVPINMLVQVEGTPLAGERQARSAGVRAHHRGRAHHHAEVGGAALRRPRGHERGDAGAVLPRRRQLDLLRAEASDHAQPRPRPRHGAARQARPAPDGAVRRAAVFSSSSSAAASARRCATASICCRRGCSARRFPGTR